MQVHTFRAESLQAALQQVRHTLGPDASIVQTREKRQRRLGLFSKWMIEVEAILDAPLAGRMASDIPVSAPVAAALTVANLEDKLPLAPLPAITAQQAPLQQAPLQQAPLQQVRAEPSTGLDLAAGSPEVAVHYAAFTQPSTSPAKLQVQAELLAGGIPAQTVSALLGEVDRLSDPHQREDVWAIRGRIGQLVGSKLNVSGSIELKRQTQDRPAVVALVGPTGVGKTTTLAKIAAGFRFDLGCRVGLIALDTFRLGAVDQLLQYAELISAALEVVSSPDQVTPALERLDQCDLVLLDTAGRAPRDAEQLRELQKFLKLAQPDATQLVVSATSSVAYIEETLRQFSVVEPSNLLITKLDETIGFGSWLNLLQTCQLPISYLTTGQHVPQDIVVASARRLTSLLLGTQAGPQEQVSPAQVNLRR